MAKLLQEEEKQFQGSYMDDRMERRLQSRNRHFSLNDLPNFHRNESSNIREPLRKRSVKFLYLSIWKDSKLVCMDSLQYLLIISD